MIKTRTFRTVTLATAGALIAALLPLSALAQGNSSDQNRGSDHRGSFIASVLKAFHRDKNEDKQNNEDKNDNDGSGHIRIGANLFLGTITSINGSTVAFTAEGNEQFTLDTTGVKIVRLSGDVFVPVSLAIGDKILVGGTASGNVVTATVIRDLSQNQPNKVKGTVTAVNGDTVTVQTKHNGSQDITTNVSTTVMLNNGLPGSLTDIIVNSMIRANGSWSSAGDVFTASLIKIK